jgi:hypothetical protein
VITEEPRPNTTSSNSERYAFYFKEQRGEHVQGLH